VRSDPSLRRTGYRLGTVIQILCNTVFMSIVVLSPRQYLWTEMGYIDMTPKTQVTKVKLDRLDLSKLTLCLKRHHQECENTVHRGGNRFANQLTKSQSDIFTKLRSHHRHPVPEHSVTPKKRAMPTGSSCSYFSPYQPLSITDLLSVSGLTYPGHLL